MIGTAIAGSLTPTRRRLVLLAVVLASVIQVLDSAVCVVTLPLMQGSLAATQDQISWVMTSYIVAVVVITPLTGALSVRLGRRPVLVVAVVGFLGGAIGSGQSDSLAEMVMFRFVQGLFGGFLMPVGHTILLDILPPAELALGMGWRSMGTMLGMSIGPAIGGLITEYFNWRWSFYLNIPVALVALAMIWWFVPETRARRREGVSWLGYVFLAVGVGALQFVLNRGQRLDWFDSTEIVAATGLTGLGLALFALHSLAARRPFIDLRILSDRTFAAGVSLVFLFTWLMFTSQVLLPAFLQDLRGYPITDVGVIMGARAAATMIASLVSGWLATRMDTRQIVILGLVLMGAGFWQMSLFTPEIGWGAVVLAAVVFGAGSGLSFVPLNVTTFTTLAPQLRDLGTSLFALLAMVGGSTGISIMVTTLVRDGQTQYARLAVHVSPYNEALRHVPLPGSWSLNETAGLFRLAAEVQRQAMTLAYIGSFRFLVLLCVVCIPLVYLMRRSPLLPAPVPRPL